MDKKLGVYVCSGCGIGDAVDVAKLCRVGSSEYKAKCSRSHPFLCGPEGLALIHADVADVADVADGGGQGVNTVVVAACSQRVNADLFQLTPPTVVERVNLREHVAWSHQAKDENTQELAEDSLRMGIVKAQKSSLPTPYSFEIDRTVLVVGGGVTGMTAALEAAAAGRQVILVEREPQLGGFAGRLHRQFPRASPYKEPQPSDIGRTVEAVSGNPRIQMHLSTQIAKVSGAPGMFDVSLKNGGEPKTVRAGSIVLATGFRPYDANKLGHLGFGISPNVVTNVMFEEMARLGPLCRPSDGKPVASVAFVQCAGSRDQQHLPYCSAVCCRTSLKQATYLRSQNPEARAFIFYKDIRTPAQYEAFYKQVQQDPGIFLTKGEVTGVTPAEGGSLSVEVDNLLLGEKVSVEVDLLVLAVGMVPATIEGEHLNLTYRLGKELPTRANGFPDSHFICFPYETQRTGIYAAGCVREPMDSAAAAEDAAGAALKAIQVVELASQGAAVHPRALDLSYPDFALQRCTQCKRCTEECPFGTLDEDEKGTPKPNPTRCRRCGICLGACPERIVSFPNYSVEIVSSMIKAVEVPEDDEDKPRILALVCENDAYPALDLAGINRLKWHACFRFVPVRCLGSINRVWIADSLSRGFDAIMLIGCKYGDDYQCHFIKGSELCNKRMENVQEVLQRLALESERVRIVQLALSDYHQLPSILDNFVEEVKAIGPNPYKGM